MDRLYLYALSGLFIILFLCCCNPAYADRITCFGIKKSITYSNITDVTFTGEMFIFLDKKTGNVIFTNEDCIVTIID